MKTAILIAILLIWSGFIIWSIKKLWRWSWRPAANQSKAVFWATVKLGGLLGTVVGSLLIAEPGQMPPLSYWQQVGVFSFALFPAMLWSTYFGLRLFHYVIESE